MTRTNKTFFAVLLTLCLALFAAIGVSYAFPLAAHAEEQAPLAAATTRTQWLDLRTRSSTTNKDEGWSWDKTGKMLTLINANFNVAYKPVIDISAGGTSVGISFPERSTLYIPEGTTSKITMEGKTNDTSAGVNIEGIHASSIFKITGGGTLEITTGDAVGSHALSIGIILDSSPFLYIEGTTVKVKTGNCNNLGQSNGACQSLGFDLRGAIQLHASANVSATSGSVTGGNSLSYGFYTEGGSVTLKSGTITGDASAATSGKSAAFNSQPHNSVTAIEGDVNAKTATYTIVDRSVRYEAPDATSGRLPDAVTGFALVPVDKNTGKLAKAGYAFAGWSTSKTGGTILPETGDVDINEGKTVVLYAQWKLATVYTVTLHKNGGEIADGSSDLTEYSEGLGAVLPSLTKTGYTFDGWFDSADFTGTQVTTISVTDAGDKEYFAKFTEISYTVTLVLSGGSGQSSLTYTSGTSKKLPTPSRIGHTFDGWYDNVDLDGSPVTEILATDSGNKTFYAKWSVAVPKFDVGNTNFEGILGETSENDSIAGATVHGGAIKYSLSGEPAGVTIDPDAGTISIPATLAAGDYSFVIRAANKLDEDKYVEKTVTLKIVDPAKLTEAVKLAKKVLEDFQATNATTKEDIVAAIRDAIAATGAEVDVGEVDNFVKTEATEDAAGSIHDYIMIVIGRQVEEIEVSLVIPKLSGTGGTEGGLSAGAIAGIAAGSVLFVMLVLYVLGYFFLYKKNKLNGKFFDGMYLPMRKLFGEKPDQVENAGDKN